MEEKIKKYLSQLEEEKKIKILLACETGSRAWGFPSPDSDYDVRIIYVHEQDWYLSLKEKKDTIEWMLENNDLDITGWDLRKVLRLLWKSNPPLLERIQSPIIYKVDAKFLKEINALATSYYSKIATMHHYLSMAKKTYEELDPQEYKLKKLFYALRASTACKWIVDTPEIPPIEFCIMLDRLNIPAAIKTRIQELIALKSGKGEGYLHSGENEIFEFISTNISNAESVANSLPAAKGQFEELDNIFRTTLSNS